MNTFSRRSSLIAIVLSLSALSPISLSAADVTYPQPNPTTDTVLVTGVAPTAVTAGQVKIGAGIIRAAGEIYYGSPTAPKMVSNAGSLSSGTLLDARLSTNVPLLNKANTFTLAQTIGGSVVPTSVAPGQVVIGGGTVAARDMLIYNSGGNATLSLHDTDYAWQIVNQHDAIGATTEGELQFKYVQGGTIPMRLTRSGNLVLGTDPAPGGVELLRVGGAATFANAAGGSYLHLGSTASGYRDQYQYMNFGGSDGGNDYGWQIGRSPTSGLIADGFYIYDIKANTKRLSIDSSGAMVLGADLGGSALFRVGGGISANGTISAKEIKVTTTGADYVFDDTYRLRPLIEVEQFIKENRHLPEIPSAKVMQQDGMSVSEIVTKQLAKIEELTLYAIAQKKEAEAARAELNDLKNRMERLEKALANR